MKKLLWFAILPLLVALACNLPGAPSPAPAVDATKIALELQATALSLQLTQVPTLPPAPTADTTKAALEAQATQFSAQKDDTPTAQQPPTLPPTPAQASMDERIQNAKILVYEDAGAIPLREWVKDTLDVMGLKYLHVGDRIGDFMSALNSSTPWDLIIVAAESRSGVQGEFWDVITPKVTSQDTALIVEMWYLSDIANGRIQSLTSRCGIQFQKTRGEVESIYLLDSAHPVFSTPNSGFSLTNYFGYWNDKGGDYLRLTGSGDASLLAGGFLREKSSYGLLANCLEGRVIFQTFSSHDYHQDDMQMLWENYIINTLTNHFLATQD